jgi:hypothetical protein
VINPNPSNLALCRWLLPSVVKSLDCGFRFMFVLGYDEGDQYFDTPEGLGEVTKWFEENVQGTRMLCCVLGLNLRDFEFIQHMPVTPTFCSTT